MAGAAAAKIIAVGNLKGGTGKSTVAVNVACAIAADGWRATIVDTDPQGTATRWAARGRLPASCRSMPIREVERTGAWLEAVRGCRGDHDALVLDLPAVVSPALASAFMLADLILIPSSISEIDLSATVRTLRYVRIARDERPANPPRVLVVPTSVRRTWWGRGGIEARFVRLREPIAPSVRWRPEHPAAFAAAEWVGTSAPRSAAHKDILAVKASVLDAIGLSHRTPPAPSSRPKASIAETAAHTYLARRAQGA